MRLCADFYAGPSKEYPIFFLLIYTIFIYRRKVSNSDCRLRTLDTKEHDENALVKFFDTTPNAPGGAGSLKFAAKFNCYLATHLLITFTTYWQYKGREHFHPSTSLHPWKRFPKHDKFIYLFVYVNNNNNNNNNNNDNNNNDNNLITYRALFTFIIWLGQFTGP